MAKKEMQSNRVLIRFPWVIWPVSGEHCVRCNGKMFVLCTVARVFFIDPSRAKRTKMERKLDKHIASRTPMSGATGFGAATVFTCCMCELRALDSCTTRSHSEVNSELCRLLADPSLCMPETKWPG